MSEKPKEYSTSSGSSKRKKRKEREKEVKKLRKVSEYFKCPKSDNVESEKEENQNVQSNENVKSFNDETETHQNVSCNNATDNVGEISRDVQENPCEKCDNMYNKECSNDNVDSISILIPPKDPGKWPERLTDQFIEECLNKGPEYFQNKEPEKFVFSERQFEGETQKRYLNVSLFSKVLCNGEIQQRRWLMFSESKGNVYCFVCKLFANLKYPPISNTFVSGFNKWKRANEKVCEHENGNVHRLAMMTWLSRVNQNSSLNKQLSQQILKEKEYWMEVLRRIVATVKFLAVRGLPFEGDDSKIGSIHNGNFLGIIELIAEFDPFLKQHLNDYANKGQGKVSYLSNTTYNELIDLMGFEVLKKIFADIKEAKYFALILDSTPDKAHRDQCAFVIRYCSDGIVYERFITFLQIYSHTGKSMADKVFSFLQKYDVDIELCRGQSYDNASNMAGIYQGLQTQIRKQSCLALFCPCSAHSLNLVGTRSVDCCSEAMSFFNLIQRLYAFFAASTHRWNLLVSNLLPTEKQKILVLKSLSTTRWSRHAESCKAVLVNYEQLVNILLKISEDSTEKADTCYEARYLRHNLLTFETGFMLILWHDILNAMNKVSDYLQKPGLDLFTAVNLLKGLKVNIASFRDQFEAVKERVLSLSPDVASSPKDQGKRLRRKKFADGSIESEVTNHVSLQGFEKLKVETLYVIVDKLNSEMTKRIHAYDSVCAIFNFVTKLGKEQLTEESIVNFLEVYEGEVDYESTKSEICQFSHFLLSSNLPENSPKDIYNHMFKNELQHVFPNIYLALRLYLTLPITNCEAERANSKLERILSLRRTKMQEQKLNSLVLMCSEHDLTTNLNFNEVIEIFSSAKARKKAF